MDSGTVIGAILEDQAASSWLKCALTAALDRDPVKALNDAEVLTGLLRIRCEEALGADLVQVQRELWEEGNDG